MARRPRLYLPGGNYHVMLRGNAGQDIFADHFDRRAFYRLLDEGTARFGYQVHGFCLMTNHVHLVLQVGETPLSRAIQSLAFRHTRWTNRRAGRYRLSSHQAYLGEDRLTWLTTDPVLGRLAAAIDQP